MWQPIETAPKDGSPILVCNQGYWENPFHLNGFPQVARWTTYHPNAKGNICWRDASGHKIATPTHWLPIMPDPDGNTGSTPLSD